MTALSTPAVSAAPELPGILQKRLENFTGKQIFEATNIDDSQAGKFLGGSAALKIKDVAKLLKLAGLKAVDDRRICCLPAEINMLRRVYSIVSDQAPWLLQEAES